MVKYVYTLSSKGTMPTHALLSIKSLLNYVPSSDIIVFFTPPRDEKHIKNLRSLDIDLRLVETKTKAFDAFGEKRHYGEKTRVCEICDDTVVFLDCDTFILDDITKLLRGNFEFKARPGTSKVQQPEWQELFKKYNQPYLDWMPNAGFLIFKNGIHHHIQNDWIRFISEDLGYQHAVNHKEQYALALSIGKYDVQKMNVKEHVMVWNGEFPHDGVVYHTGKSLESQDFVPKTFKGNLHMALKNLIKGKI